MKVTFLLPDDDEPGNVFVAGDFNSWNPGATMLRRREKIRSASLTLSGGRRYAFRYYRDGRWFNDADADSYEINEYGERNCILDLTQA